MGGMVRQRVCTLHGHEQHLTDDLGYHCVHCGRLTPHIIHSALEDGVVYVAGNVPILRVTVEDAVFAGSGSRMDVVITNPLADQQTMFVDVTGGTAMGDCDYAGLPRNGYRREPDWRGVAGSAARGRRPANTSSTRTRCGRLEQRALKGRVSKISGLGGRGPGMSSAL